MHKYIFIIIFSISSFAWSQDGTLTVVGTGSARGADHEDFISPWF